MSSIQFGGLISGIKTSDIIDALMAVKKQPLTALQKKEADLTAQKAAYAQLSTSMADVIAKVKAFTVSKAGASRTASSSDSSVFSASATPTAAIGQYRISVDRLATTTKAVSTAALGTAVSVGVDISKTLDNAFLAAPVTSGTMSMVVDGTTVQVAVGNTATTTMQSLMSSIATALQGQLQATDAGATVSASIAGGKLQLAVSGGASTHTISFGVIGDTSNAATALGLKTQGVTDSLNPTMTGTAYLDPKLTAQNLAGSVTGGQISAIVDGVIVHYTVGDPAATTLQQVMDGFANAVQTQLRGGGPVVAADAGASASMSIAGNRMQLGVSGGANAHSISFGVAGDASNALAVFGLSALKVTGQVNPTITADANLGVVRTTSALDSAGLTGLTSTKTGVLTINGAAINYDTTADSLTTIITRINNSTAGVVASLDRTNDQLIITRKESGSQAIDIQDSGTLATALHLAPGTTLAQSIGQSAQVTVDGRTVTSASNTVTNAIDGVTLNLLDKSALGETTTVTVGVDQTAISQALNAFVASFNAMGDVLDKLTASTPGQAGGTAGSSGPLSSDFTALTMFVTMRDDLMHSVLGLSGTMNSLQSIGISTGSVGAALGTTTRLQVDQAKLTSALSSDPSRVATLLNDANGKLQPLLDRLEAFQDPDDSRSYIQAHTKGLDSEISVLRHQEDDMQDRIDSYQAALEAKYAALEATLAQLQTQSSAISSQVSSMYSSNG